jgi:hypothetical protein
MDTDCMKRSTSSVILSRGSNNPVKRSLGTTQWDINFQCVIRCLCICVPRADRARFCQSRLLLEKPIIKSQVENQYGIKVHARCESSSAANYFCTRSREKSSSRGAYLLLAVCAAQWHDERLNFIGLILILLKP